jgi:cysteine synthase
MKAENVIQLIGNTPHLRINKIFPGTHEVWMKLERSNPGASIKDRIAMAMIEDAEEKGLLGEGSVIVEPTSGNTGIGLAMIGAVKGYRVVLVMPESMSLERRRIMALFGASFELTPREKGMRGAIERAQELLEEIPNAWMPRQFDNPANVAVHEITTAREILEDFPQGFDYLVTGVGTGGHITGVAKVLKKHFPDLRVYAVEPALSPVLSGGNPGPHPIQGIGAGFVPSIVDRTLIDKVITISQEEAYHYTRQAGILEGLFIGISSGASLAAVARTINEAPEGSKILTFNYDTGERYLSIQGLFD